MGIGYVAVGNNIYDGFAVVGTTALENGMFVDLTYASGVFTAAAGADYFVCNEDDEAEPGATSSKDITLSPGTYLKLKTLLPGEHFVTSKATGSLAIGGKVSVSGGGIVTGTDGKHPSEIVDIFTVDGVTCYRCRVMPIVVTAGSEG